MAFHGRDLEEPEDEDTLFDRAGLLSNRIKPRSDVKHAIAAKRITSAKTATLIATFFGIGLSSALIGSTLLDPRKELAHPTFLYMFLSRTIGFVIGSIIGGFLFEVYSQPFLMFVGLLISAGSMSILPLCTTIPAALAVLFVLGVAFRFVYLGGNFLCIQLWGRNSGLFLQALHFSFALGVFFVLITANTFIMVQPTKFAGTTTVSNSHALPSNLQLLQRFQRSTDAIFDVRRIHFQEYDDPLFKTLGNRVKRQEPSLNNTMLSHNISEMLTVNNETVSSTPTVDPKINVTLTTPISTVNPNISKSVTPKVDQKPSSTGEKQIPVISNGTITFNTTANPMINATLSVAATPKVKPKPSFTDGTKIKEEKDPWDRRPPAPTPVPPPVNPSTTEATTNGTTISSQNNTSLNVTQIAVSNTTVVENIVNATTSPLISDFDGNSTTAVTSVVETSNTNVSSSYNQNFTDETEVEVESRSVTVTSTISHLPLAPQNSTVANASEVTVTPNISSTGVSNNPEVQPELNATNSDSGVTKVITSTITPEIHINNSNGTNKNSSDQTGPLKFDAHSSNKTVATIVPTEVTTLPNTDDKKNDEASKNNGKHAESSSVSSELSTAGFSFQDSDNDTQVSSVDVDITSVNSDSKDTQLSSTKETPPASTVKASKIPEKSTVRNEKLANNNTIEDRLTTTAETQIVTEKTTKASPIITTKPPPPITVTPKESHKPDTFSNISDGGSEIFRDSDIDRLQIVYLGVGIFLLMTSLVFLLFLCWNSKDFSEVAYTNGGMQISRCELLSPRFSSLVPILGFFFLSSGLEASLTYLIPDFTSAGKLPPSWDGFLYMIFWSTYVFTRGISVCCSSGFVPSAMILVNFACCAAGVAGFLLFEKTMDSILWCGVAAFGIGLASMFPSGLLFLYQQMCVKIDQRILAYVITVASLGELIFPLLKWIPDGGSYLPSLVTGLTISSFVLFLWAWKYTSRMSSTASNITPPKPGYHLAPAHDEDDDGLEMSAGSMAALLNGKTDDCDIWDRAAKID